MNFEVKAWRIFEKVTHQGLLYSYLEALWPDVNYPVQKVTNTTPDIPGAQTPAVCALCKSSCSLYKVGAVERIVGMYTTAVHGKGMSVCVHVALKAMKQ